MFKFDISSEQTQTSFGSWADGMDNDEAWTVCLQA